MLIQPVLSLVRTADCYLSSPWLNLALFDFFALFFNK